MRRDVPVGSRPDLKPKPPVQRSGQWVLELPFLRPLSLNDRDIWQVRMGKVRPWRQAAQVLARHQRIPKCNRIIVELFYTPRDDRARDPLNLVASLKAVEDGLVDAGVIPDDSSKYHTSVMPVITAKGPVRKDGNRFWVVVTAV